MKTSEKEFDCVAMMRAIRDRLDAEMAELSPDEQIAFVHRNAEAARHKLGIPPAEATPGVKVA